MIATGKPYVAYAKPSEYAHRPARGPSCWDWSLQPTKDERGETTGVVLSLVNVTERIKAQEALRAAAERLHFVVHNAPVALWAVNRDANYTLLEGTLMVRLGLKPDELIGQSAMDHPCYDPDLPQHLARALRGEEFGADVEWKGQSFHTRCAPIRGAAGQIEGVMGVATDITERRAAEERSRELAREMVRLQEEDRRQMTHAIYEDAGQVLAVVKMQLESLGSLALADSDMFREQAGQAAQRLGDVISGLRLFADELRPPALDVAGLPLALKNLCARVGAHAGLTIEFSSTGCDDLPATEAITLYRFVQEALTITTHCARANAVRVHLGREAGAIVATVEDDGTGSDPHAISPQREKTGAGLVALQEKFNLLGGHLEIVSLAGQGTRLVACLPVP